MTLALLLALGLCQPAEPRGWFDMAPVASPEGTQIAFRSTRANPDAEPPIVGLCLLSLAEGSEPEVLVTGEVRDAVWSADGSRVLYATPGDDRRDLTWQFLDLATREAKLLPSPRGTNIRRCACLADGRVACALAQIGGPGPIGQTEPLRLALLDPAKPRSAPVYLADPAPPEGEAPLPPMLGKSGRAPRSLLPLPDGRLLVSWEFVAARLTECPREVREAPFELWVYDLSAPETPPARIANLLRSGSVRAVDGARAFVVPTEDGAPGAVVVLASGEKLDWSPTVPGEVACGDATLAVLEAMPWDCAVLEGGERFVYPAWLEPTGPEGARSLLLVSARADGSDTRALTRPAM